jgi:hypothetical protein
MWCTSKLVALIQHCQFLFEVCIPKSNQKNEPQRRCVEVNSECLALFKVRSEKTIYGVPSNTAPNIPNTQQTTQSKKSFIKSVFITYLMHRTHNNDREVFNITILKKYFSL